MFTETYSSNTGCFFSPSLSLTVWWWDPKGERKPVGMQAEERGNLLVDTINDMHFPFLKDK